MLELELDELFKEGISDPVEVWFSDADSGNTVHRLKRLRAIVQLDSSQEGFSDVTGTMMVRLTDIDKVRGANTVEVRGEVYQISGHGTEQSGLVEYSIVRHVEEVESTDLYDLHGNKIPLAE